MAERLKSEMGIETAMVVGRPGEFSVVVDGAVVARKRIFFPSEQRCLDAVRQALRR